MPSPAIRSPARILLPGLFAAFLLAACAEDGGADRQNAPRVVPVVTTKVSSRQIADRIEAVGSTRASDSVDITARVSNVITRINFTEGSEVEKGRILAELESSEARANLAQAEAALVEIRTQYERSQELIRSNVISQAVLDQQKAQVNAAQARVAAARAVLADHTLRAPFDGRTGLRRVSVGSLVTPGTVITTLDRVSEMNLDFAVPESFLAALAVGQQVRARSVAYPDETFVGVVDSIDARIDVVTRTVTVRARINNSEGRLRPGMFMTVVLEKDARNVLVTPELALVPEADRKYVFVVQDDDTVTQRQVEIGTRLPGIVEITAGLEAGEEIVIEGTQSLRHGAAIRRTDAPPATGDAAGNGAQP